MTTPLTAVIITHERPALFADAYRSLQVACERYGGKVERLVVNSSRERLLATADPSVREIHVPDQTTAAQKREIALRNAHNEWLVSLDDDCTIPQEALVVVGSAIERATEDVAALFCVTEFVGPRTFWFKSLEDTDFFTDFTWARDYEELGWGPTSLSVFRRSALIAAGGFDVTMGIPAGGEDVEMCLRLRRAGGRLRAIPATLAFHTTATWNTLRGNLRRSFNYGRGEGALCRRYPEMVRLDFESHLLRTVPFIIAGAFAKPAALPTLALLFVFSTILGDYSREMILFRKGAAQAACLTLYRWAYKLGRVRSSRRLSGELFGFDWGTLAGSGPSNRFDLSFAIRWTSAVGGVLLFVLAISR